MTHPATVHLAIARGAGFAIAAVGLFRMGRHLAGIDRGHEHRPRRLDPDPSTWTIGLAAGFVPCWDAVALVVVANSVGRLGWGLILLFAFSLGLGSVLVGVGWVAGRMQRGLASSLLSGRTRHRLGFVAGLILAVIGIGLFVS